MLPLVHAPAWIVASVLLVLAVLYVSLAPLSMPVELPTHFDKVEHAAAYVFLAVWFTGLVARPRYWRVAVALVAFLFRQPRLTGARAMIWRVRSLIAVIWRFTVSARHWPSAQTYCSSAMAVRMNGCRVVLHCTICLQGRSGCFRKTRPP